MDMMIRTTSFQEFCLELADAVRRGYELRYSMIETQGRLWWATTQYVALLSAPEGFDITIGPVDSL